MKIFEIPNMFTVTWNPEVRAIIDTITSYGVTLAQFKEAVMVKGLNHARTNNGQAWIVDSSKATGSFSQEIQAFIASDVFPAFHKNGIKYFITINSQVSALTNLTVKTYKAQTGANGLQLVEVNSVDDAFSWLKNNAK